MTVTVRLFAILRQRAGRESIELELPEGARVADALAQVDHLAGGLTLVMAVNREYAAADHPLAPGDELALIPPVSGGAPSTHSPSSAFQIGARALISSMISRAPANASPRCGADAATITDGSLSGTRPTRCSAAAAHRPWRSIAAATIACICSPAISA